MRYGDKVLYNASTEGANKNGRVRPWMIFPGTESDETLRPLIDLMETELLKIKNNPFEINGSKITLHRLNMSMADGKVITRVLQLAGGYCTMCERSGKECHDPTVICEGSQITRHISDLHDLALSLADDEGCIKGKTGDYSTRKGLTGTPMTNLNLVELLPVCHAKINTANWIVDLIVRSRAHKKWYSSYNIVKYSKEEKKNYDVEYNIVKRTLQDKLLVNIGDPKDMVTGETFKRMASDEARVILADLLCEEEREGFKKMHLGTIILNYENKILYVCCVFYNEVKEQFLQLTFFALLKIYIQSVS